MSTDHVINVLEIASCWFAEVVTLDDIDEERQQLEAKYECKIAVHEIERARGKTRVTWKVDD